ncbi:Glypican-6 Secreted glypican-6 Precursor [Larimichthys crocea]|uniref:Glypican-6 Secreted glypican-6 n=2 Tax=Larimichthys crocea TaxID=215358 RepID=A0A6G0I2Z8_LARCR|nr:Glypican-6 Secreted glypican-6 Precursor [Larimichthys crocea]
MDTRLFSPRYRLLVLLCTVYALSGTRSPVVAAGRSCADTRQVYSEKGYSTGTAPQTQISGEHLRLCPQDYTCCSSQMEETLALQSERDFLKSVEENSQFLLTTFTQRHRKFDGSDELFVELRRYYSGGSVSLSEVLSDFWSRLVERVFSLVNPQYQFSEDYLECVSKHAEQLQPFGDVPRKLRVQVSRAFIASRALSQGLAYWSGYCQQSNKADCRFRGCLANQADLDTEWNNFIDALYQISEKLEGPFNMELAADSISVKVSEAIMHMQENSVSISTKVFQGCGSPRPAPGRSKRSPKESGGNRRPFRTYSPEEKPTTAAGTNLDRLVTELKERLRPMRGFWVSLPHTICNDEKMAADVTNEDRCWNGQTRGRYLPDVTGDGLVSQINNPEVEVDIARPDVRTRQLIMELRVVTNKLRHAQTGQDMDFMDSEEGSGSGGGDHGERYNDDWPGYGPYSPPNNNPPRNPATNPAKPPRVRERNGSKWNRNNGHGRVRSATNQLTLSLFPLLSLPFVVTVAPMWR